VLDQHVPRRVIACRAARAIMGAVVLSCSGNSTGPNAHGVADIVMAPDTLTIPSGDSATIQGQAVNASGTPVIGVPLFWSSGDSTIASVDQNGKVKAVGLGAVSIDASTAGVSPRHPARIVVIAQPAASIVLAPNAIAMHIGGAFQFTDTTKDAAGHVVTGRPVLWSSSDTTVAPVDQAGLVLAKRLGSATITVSSGSVSATATLTVRAAPVGPVATVVVTPDTATITNSNNLSVQLTATLLDTNGNTVVGPPITWSSDNTDVAVVSSTGVVMADKHHSQGTATITATSEGIQGTAAVTVVDGHGGHAPRLNAVRDPGRS
jgi:uncharacterized protein YjdB